MSFMRTFLGVLLVFVGLGMALCGSFALGFYIAQSVGASELWSNVGGLLALLIVASGIIAFFAEIERR